MFCEETYSLFDGNPVVVFYASSITGDLSLLSAWQEPFEDMNGNALPISQMSDKKFISVYRIMVSMH